MRIMMIGLESDHGGFLEPAPLSLKQLPLLWNVTSWEPPGYRVGHEKHVHPQNHHGAGWCMPFQVALPLFQTTYSS
jgi:hypothetical protein